MTNIDQLLLLISYQGINVDSFTKSYLKALKQSDLVFLIEENLLHAQNFGTSRVNQLLCDYRALNWNCITYEDVIILTSRLTYLASRTFERYYINPLAVGNRKIKTKSIGELMFFFDGDLVPFNEMISKAGYTIEYKMDAIDKQVAFYHAEMVNFVLKPIKIIVDSKKVKAKFNISSLQRVVEKLTLIVVNFLALTLMIIPNGKFKNVILNGFSANSIGAKIIWIYLIILVIYDMLIALFFARRSYHYEPLYYSRRYLKVKKKKVFKSLRIKAIKLADYLKRALISNSPLEADIRLFARLGDDNLDLDSVDQISQNLEKKPYRVLSAIHNISFGLMLFALFALIVFLIVYYFTRGDLL